MSSSTKSRFLDFGKYGEYEIAKAAGNRLFSLSVKEEEGQQSHVKLHGVHLCIGMARNDLPKGWNAINTYLWMSRVFEVGCYLTTINTPDFEGWEIDIPLYYGNESERLDDDYVNYYMHLASGIQAILDFVQIESSQVQLGVGHKRMGRNITYTYVGDGLGWPHHNQRVVNENYRTQDEIRNNPWPENVDDPLEIWQLTPEHVIAGEDREERKHEIFTLQHPDHPERVLSLYVPNRPNPSRLLTPSSADSRFARGAEAVEPMSPHDPAPPHLIVDLEELVPSTQNRFAAGVGGGIQGQNQRAGDSNIALMNASDFESAGLVGRRQLPPMTQHVPGALFVPTLSSKPLPTPDPHNLDAPAGGSSLEEQELLVPTILTDGAEVLTLDSARSSVSGGPTFGADSPPLFRRGAPSPR